MIQMIKTAHKESSFPSDAVGDPGLQLGFWTQRDN